MQEAKDLIQIKDLHKVFKIKGRDVVALEGIDLGIREGEFFGIIGLSGAGKSTLVRCINFLEKPGFLCILCQHIPPFINKGTLTGPFKLL